MKLENMQKNVLIKCFEIIKCNARAQEREREKTAESESDKHTPYSLFFDNRTCCNTNITFLCIYACLVAAAAIII